MDKIKKVPIIMVVIGVLGSLINFITEKFNESIGAGFDSLIASGLILVFILGVLSKSNLIKK